MYVCMYTYIRKHKHTQTHTHTCKYDAGDQDVLPIYTSSVVVWVRREREKKRARDRARAKERGPPATIAKPIARPKVSMP
jgi:hypothetical protein